MSERFDLIEFLDRKHEWSGETFGPRSYRDHVGPLDHLRKEIEEGLANPEDVTEFADLIFLATDAAWRAGHSSEAVAKALEDKLAINRARRWPDWQEAEQGKAIEHVREGEDG